MELNRTNPKVKVTRPPGSGRSLVARAAGGDRAAFTELVAAHHPDMLRLAGAIVSDPDLARDAVQSAWQRTWTGLRGLRDEARVRSWLLSVTANEARQLLRSRRPVESLPQYVLLELPDPTPAIGDGGFSYEDRAVDAALSRLDPRDRELLAMRYVIGFNSVELGAHLGSTPEGVRGRLKRVLDTVREELADG